MRIDQTIELFSSLSEGNPEEKLLIREIDGVMRDVHHSVVLVADLINKNSGTEDLDLKQESLRQLAVDRISQKYKAPRDEVDARVSIAKLYRESRTYDQEKLDVDTASCENGFIKYSCIFWIPISAIKNMLREDDEPVEGELEDEFAPPRPEGEVFEICDLDSFITRCNTIRTFFRIYAPALKRPKKNYVVRGVSYQRQAGLIANAAQKIAAYIRGFEDGKYVPTFENGNRVRVWVSRDLSKINAIYAYHGRPKQETYIGGDLASLQRLNSLTNLNTLYFLLNNNEIHANTITRLFGVRRNKVGIESLVRTLLLPPGSTLEEQFCFPAEQQSWGSIGEALETAVAETTYAPAVRELFDNKPEKILEDIAREDLLLEDANFRKIIIEEVQNARIGAEGLTLRSLLQEIFSNSEGPATNQKEILQNFAEFFAKFGWREVLTIAAATGISRALAAGINFFDVEKWIARRLQDVAGFDRKIKQLLRKFPLDAAQGILVASTLADFDILRPLLDNPNDEDLQRIVREAQESQKRRSQRARENQNRRRERQLETRRESLAELEEEFQDNPSARRARRIKEAQKDLKEYNQGITFDDLLISGAELERAIQSGNNPDEQVRNVIAEIVATAYACDIERGGNISLVIFNFIMETLGVDQILEEFDDFVDFLESWDITNIDFCNLPDFPFKFAFDFNFGLFLPRLPTLDFFQLLFALLLRLLQQLLLALLRALIRFLLSLIPDIPLDFDVCEIANFIRDFASAFSDKACGKINGSQFASRVLDQAGICNVLGFRGRSIQPRTIQEALTDFCSITDPNSVFLFMRGDASEETRRLFSSYLQARGGEFDLLRNTLESNPNGYNDFGQAVGALTNFAEIEEELFPFIPSMIGISTNICEEPTIEEIKEEIRKICDLNISNERLDSLLEAERERNSQKFENIAEFLSGNKKIDEIFRDSLPPVAHPSNVYPMLEPGDPIPDLNLQSGQEPLVSRDYELIADHRVAVIEQLFDGASEIYQSEFVFALSQSLADEVIAESITSPLSIETGFEEIISTGFYQINENLSVQFGSISNDASKLTTEQEFALESDTGLFYSVSYKGDNYSTQIFVADEEQEILDNLLISPSSEDNYGFLVFDAMLPPSTKTLEIEQRRDVYNDIVENLFNQSANLYQNSRFFNLRGDSLLIQLNRFISPQSDVSNAQVADRIKEVYFSGSFNEKDTIQRFIPDSDRYSGYTFYDTDLKLANLYGASNLLAHQSLVAKNLKYLPMFFELGTFVPGRNYENNILVKFHQINKEIELNKRGLLADFFTYQSEIGKIIGIVGGEEQRYQAIEGEHLNSFFDNNPSPDLSFPSSFNYGNFLFQSKNQVYTIMWLPRLSEVSNPRAGAGVNVEEDIYAIDSNYDKEFLIRETGKSKLIAFRCYYVSNPRGLDIPESTSPVSEEAHRILRSGGEIRISEFDYSEFSELNLTIKEIIEFHYVSGNRVAGELYRPLTPLNLNFEGFRLSTLPLFNIEGDTVVPVRKSFAGLLSTFDRITDLSLASAKFSIFNKIAIQLDNNYSINTIYLGDRLEETELDIIKRLRRLNPFESYPGFYSYKFTNYRNYIYKLLKSLLNGR